MSHASPVLLTKYVIIYEICHAETEIILFFISDVNYIHG